MCEELQQISSGVQIIIDNNDAYLVTDNIITEIDPPTNNIAVTQHNDMLMPYAMDTLTALEECNQTGEDNCDIDGLLRIVTNIDSSNGQKLSAYRRIGNYLHDAQKQCAAAALKKEMQDRSHQNGLRIYQIAIRVQLLFQEIGSPYTRNFRHITPNWIYKLPKSEFNRFLQLCNTLNAQLMHDLWEFSMGSQELPIEGGNVCGGVNFF